MNAEFIASMEYWEREKGLDREILISAVEDAMVSAAKRAVGPARELRCEIDRKDGDIRAFATLIVVESVTDKQSEISLDSAQRFKPDAQLEEELEVEVTPKNFGRIASQNAKQALNIADRGYVLVQGRNAYTDTGAALMADPEVRRAFLGG